ncbi:Detected protein of unknown function [Hibiscus syriacus]|uniref:Bromo domain-containing protein n=1 Tax=Hibiscus syriacus TaxID=106335 RepID=A0A6A2ZEG6_HIBSY|nr:myb-like protein X [Hibiscus syriacus]KAE8689986.1 Detected protein of unknown function [Hibiscus syriacus]
MAKPHGFPDKQSWGTREGLLLACAVHRYGNDSWDSVAMELQKRTYTPQQPLFFTPLSCQQMFQDLKRRFSINGDDDKTTNNISTTSVPWLDELRKLRVAELRREIQQYDLSIVSLQLKVQKLKEEREQSLIENGKETEKSDLEREKGSEKMEEENEPENKTRRPVHSREESDRENHSVNEFNSTDPKEKSPGTGMEEAKIEPEPFEPVGRETGKVVQSVKPAGGDSCNGSSDTVAKELAENKEPVDPRETGDSSESVAESKRDEPNRESSDVQSTASLSDKEKKKGTPDGPDKPDNRELDQSPAMKEVYVGSQPLVEFLEILRFHNIGSLFERRLESQETPDYLNLIRQHLDLETIQTRLEEGWYSGCQSKFFRDLLLLLNNAILFFSKESSEFAAAIQLRQLVSKEIATQFPNPSLLPKEQSSTLPESQTPLKPEPELSLTLTMKTKLSVPLIACRKRSSIAAKSSSGQEKKRQPTVSLMNEKPALDWKQNDKSAEEAVVTTKRRKERSASGAKKATKNAKAQNNTNANGNSDSNNTTAAISSKGGSLNENSESKGGKEKNNTNVSSKKKSAANFLNRMRDNGALTETLKGSDNGKGGDAEQKKTSSSKGGQQKGRSSTPRSRSSGRRRKEKVSPVKKSTGRPPKRAVGAGKRGREVENDSGGGHAKKRSRK